VDLAGDWFDYRFLGKSAAVVVAAAGVELSLINMFLVFG
jgi:hypothetical protein